MVDRYRAYINFSCLASTYPNFCLVCTPHPLQVTSIHAPSAITLRSSGCMTRLIKILVVGGGRRTDMTIVFFFSNFIVFGELTFIPGLFFADANYFWQNNEVYSLNLPSVVVININILLFGLFVSTKKGAYSFQHRILRVHLLEFRTILRGPLRRTRNMARCTTTVHNIASMVLSIYYLLLKSYIISSSDSL